MCQEVFQIAMSMDLKSVEMQLALQCAPLITGARISNMLMIDSADERPSHRPRVAALLVVVLDCQNG